MDSHEVDVARENLRAGTRVLIGRKLASQKHRMNAWVRKFLRKVLPRTLNGDRIFAFIDFVLKQHRLPRQHLLFNDYLFGMKVSGELLSLPRQLVSDKELCKLYVDHIIGPGRTVPTISVLRHKNEVQESAFPADCVVKATHMSNRTIIRRNGAALDLDRIRSFFDDSLYETGREMNYRYLEPKVIVEPILWNELMIELKIHCYKGQVRIISVQPMERQALERLDRTWRRLDIKQRKRPLPSTPTERPACLNAVIDAAERLSEGFEYIRVDVYVNDTEWVVGELTNCHMNIGMAFKDLEQEKVFSQVLFGNDSDGRRQRGRSVADPVGPAASPRVD